MTKTPSTVSKTGKSAKKSASASARTTSSAPDPVLALNNPAAPQDDPAGLVTPVVRGLRLLSFIAAGGNTTNLSEAARQIDVNRITLTRLLTTLEHEGMIEAMPGGGHQVSWKFLTLAAAGLFHHDLMGAARRVLADLCATLGLSAYLTVLDGDDVVYVLRDMPPAGLISHITLGSRVPARQVAPGRALLQVAAPGLASASQQTACFWSHSGFESGINACAVAVLRPDGRGAPAAISVAGPEAVFKSRDGFPEQVEDALKRAAQELGLIAAAQGGSLS